MHILTEVFSFFFNSGTIIGMCKESITSSTLSDITEYALEIFRRLEQILGTKLDNEDQDKIDFELEDVTS